MKDNEYFNRFLQYIMANLAAAIVYFLSAALISLGGMPDEATSRLLSAVVTALPFALAVFVATLRDKSLPRGDLRAYFTTSGTGDLITYAVWAILGGMVALAGEAAGITVYLFLAQAIPTASLIAAIGTGLGLPLAVVLNIALYAGAKVLGVKARR